MLATMDLRVLRVLVQATLVVLLAQTGSAIKCYSCTSKTDAKCGDPADLAGLTASECTPDILQTVNNVFGNVFKTGYPQGADMQMACQKVDYTETSGDKMTIRSCSLADTDTFDSCGAFEAANKLSTGRKMSFCGLCSTDACNSTDRLRPGAFILPLVLSGLIALFTACIA